MKPHWNVNFLNIHFLNANSLIDQYHIYVIILILISINCNLINSIKNELCFQSVCLQILEFLHR